MDDPMFRQYSSADLRASVTTVFDGRGQTILRRKVSPDGSERIECLRIVEPTAED